MKNIFISNLHKKGINNFTTNVGLFLRKKIDKPFKIMCNIFTNAHIVKENVNLELSDEEYFAQLDEKYIPLSNYNLHKNKNNIIVERYPKLEKDEPYIFVCNHTCPEDIATVLNILDRNAYLILGSIESLQYNPEMYLSWINGMIPFDIMDKKQRKQVLDKMKRVLKTNSILIFPEGSHNYSPNKLINNLFDGPVNLALQTNRKIVVVSMIKDNDNSVSYIDVSNPIDIKDIKIDMSKFVGSKEEIEKYYIKSLTNAIRDKMATGVYHIIVRHFKTLERNQYKNLEEDLRLKKIQDAFKKLKWNRDVFDAEYLVKKTQADKEYEDVVKALSNLTLNPNVLFGLNNRHWVLSRLDIENKDVSHRMRQFWLNTQKSKEKKKILIKKK